MSKIKTLKVNGKTMRLVVSVGNDYSAISFLVEENGLRIKE